MSSITAVSPADIETLLSICRLELGTANAPDGTAIANNRWDGLLATAIEHGLVGQLQKTASTTESIPVSSLRSIETAFLEQATRNFQLTDALFEILHCFRDCAIDVAVLKGPAVALITGGQIARREFRDLDLLVHPGDINRAAVALGELGFQQTSGDLPNRKGEKDIQFVRDSDKVLVELHWLINAPARSFPLEATGIWDRLQTVYFQNEPISTPGLEDTFLALCIHGSVHGWTSIKWAFDIARIVRYKAASLDWATLMQRSRSVGCNRALLVSVQLVSLLFGVKPPDEMATQMSGESSTGRLAERIRLTILANEPLSGSDRIASHIQIHDRLWGRFSVAYKYLPVPDSHQIPWRPLRYMIRSRELIRLYGHKWLRTMICE
jgi:hypothetical protein